ncbi:diphosphate--fructose-6-phosphate 1-phosphotransferase [Hydrogenophilus hirschii]
MGAIRRIVYAQSGGMTAVINASAAGVIAEAQRRGLTLFAARYGMHGLLAGDLIAVPPLSAEQLQRLSHTPGGIFGTARRDLPDPEIDATPYDLLFQVLAHYDIDALLYNGGNGSIATVAQIDREAKRRGIPLTVIGIPKTIDNDLEGTHFSPGYPSAARYLITSFLEASLDLASFPAKGARAFVMETMGRNAGWLAAAVKAASAVLADEGPHLIVLPEMRWDKTALLAAADAAIARTGYCTVVVAEGATLDGEQLAYQGVEKRRYVQLGGAGSVIGGWLRDALGAKVHVAVPDYLQRAAAHWVSAVDHRVAWQVGETAVAWADEGTRSGVMVGVVRDPATSGWRMEAVDAATVGNRERRFPASWIAAPFQVDSAFLDYLLPLLEGCPQIPCGAHGLPDFFPFATLTERSDAPS